MEFDLEIGGFQSLSTIDYPHNMACVVYLSGCNMACPYCHNPNLNVKKGVIPVDKFFESVKEQRTFVSHVVVCGGEPTSQRNTSILCERLKKMGYRVKLDTNGTDSSRLKYLIQDGLVDYVAMDIKGTQQGYRECGWSDYEEIEDSIEILESLTIPHMFRTTCVHGVVEPEDLPVAYMLISSSTPIRLQKANVSGSVLKKSFFFKEGHKAWVDFEIEEAISRYKGKFNIFSYDR